MLDGKIAPALAADSRRVIECLGVDLRTVVESLEQLCQKASDDRWTEGGCGSLSTWSPA